jgi:cytoskeletal protein CcmA (bactofilin family)
MTTRRRTARPTMALAALAILLLALTAIPVQAANNYNFPDRLPPDCRDQLNGNYICGALTLDAGDIITVSSPATVTVTAAMTIGANTSINATGSASDLQFITTGFGLGVDTIMHANISSAAAGLIGARSKISGNISTDAGILTVNDNVTISGNIDTTAGAVNMGAGNQVNGNITTQAGVVTIGADSAVSGFIHTDAGVVKLGANNKTSMGTAPKPADEKTIRAGTDFTLLAKTSPVGNHRGVLTLDASRLMAQKTSNGKTIESGGIIGVLTPPTLTANAQAVIAAYSEVGYLYIGIGAYRDDSFTIVDSVVGDCITSIGNNANLADTLVDGKYGCSIGNNDIAALGRFVPHHFSTVITPDTEKRKNAAMFCTPALIAARQP